MQVALTTMRSILRTLKLRTAITGEDQTAQELLEVYLKEFCAMTVAEATQEIKHFMVRPISKTQRRQGDMSRITYELSMQIIVPVQPFGFKSISANRILLASLEQLGAEIALSQARTNLERREHVALEKMLGEKAY